MTLDLATSIAIRATAEAILRETLDYVAECKADLLDVTDPGTAEYEHALSSYAETIDDALARCLALLGIAPSPDPRKEPA